MCPRKASGARGSLSHSLSARLIPAYGEGERFNADIICTIIHAKWYKYLRDKVDVQGNNTEDEYTQEKCLENLKALRAEKELQYQDQKRKLEELA